jgi:hypothetical protein
VRNALDQAVVVVEASQPVAPEPVVVDPGVAVGSGDGIDVNAVVDIKLRTITSEALKRRNEGQSYSSVGWGVLDGLPVDLRSEAIDRGVLSDTEDGSVISNLSTGGHHEVSLDVDNL